MTVRFRLYLLLALLAMHQSSLALSTGLPESYPLLDAAKGPNPLDQGFQQWITKHSVDQSVIDLSRKDFSKFLAKQDEVGSLFFELRYANDNGLPVKEYLTAAEDFLDDDDKVEQATSHPLFAYLLGEVLATPKIDEDLRDNSAELLWNLPDKSCPQRRLVLKRLASGLSAQTEQPEELLDRVLQYRGSDFRREAFNAFLKNLPLEKRDTLKMRLKTALKEYPRILRENSWIATAREQAAASLSNPDDEFNPAEDAARKGQCVKARSELEKSLTSVTRSEKSLNAALATVETVGLCYKKQGTSVRIGFYETMEQPFEKAYGFSGLANIRLRKGILYWSENDFDKSRSILLEMLKRAQDEKDRVIEAKAVLALGNLEENSGNLPAAGDYYRAYTSKFSDQEGMERAVMALALMVITDKKWEEALSLLQNVIHTQTELGIDQRSPVSLPFALFWAGRIHLMMGHKDLALEIWRRLAAEHYSTFYGALGHYMLEKASGKKHQLEPTRVNAFKDDMLRRGFNDKEQLQVNRASIFLQSGLRDEALCEVKEIDAADGQNDRILTKSAFLYVAGDWLQTVKIFSNLPRTYRNTLPLGFERLLFPKAFEQHIQAYTRKLGVDPFFVMGLIRQESVFNPRASSPVGARGLMQLMPDTAKMELGQVPKAYLPREKSGKMKQVSRNRTLLYDAETNIAIGVHHLNRLLKRYKNPVFALSSYNASPAATERWLRNIPAEDVLTFIERIPYRETQAYVKFVLRNYFYYQRWYGTPDRDLPQLEAILAPFAQVALKGSAPATTKEAAPVKAAAGH